MQVFFNTPLTLLIVVAAVVVILLITTASQHRRHSSRTEQRLCRNCGTGHPSVAEFCRRCGKKL